MTKQRVCILTVLHPSLNPRLVKEADALTEAGFEVSVIAPEFSEWALAADRSFEDRAWRIVARPQFGPLAPRWTRLKELIRRTAAGAAVEMLGVTFTPLVHAAWHPAAPALVREAQQCEADLYVAHYPGALPAAATAADSRGALYAYDAEDFHLGDLPDDARHALKNRMLKAIEGRYLPGCAYVTAAAPLIADAYREAYGIPRPHNVLNVFPRSYGPEQPSVSGAERPGPSIYWFSQTIGPNRGLECAIEALARTRSKPHLYLRGTVSDVYRTSILNAADTFGVRDRVRLLAPEPPEEMARLAASFDLGLVGETGNTRNRAIALTNKQFVYLLAGIPSLMSRTPGHQAFAADLSPAVELFRIDDPIDLARAIDFYLCDTDRLAAARAHAFTLGSERYNWDLEKAKLVLLAEQAVARRAPSPNTTDRSHYAASL